MTVKSKELLTRLKSPDYPQFVMVERPKSPLWLRLPSYPQGLQRPAPRTSMYWESKFVIVATKAINSRVAPVLPPYY